MTQNMKHRHRAHSMHMDKWGTGSQARCTPSHGWARHQDTVVVSDHRGDTWT